MLKLSSIGQRARSTLLVGLLGAAGLALAISPATAQMRGGGGGFHGGGFHGSGAFHGGHPTVSNRGFGFDRGRFGRFDRDDRFGRFGFRGPGWGWGWGPGWAGWWGYPYYYGYPYCSYYDYYYGYCAY